MTTSTSGQRALDRAHRRLHRRLGVVGGRADRRPCRRAGRTAGRRARRRPSPPTASFDRLVDRQVEHARHRRHLAAHARRPRRRTAGSMNMSGDSRVSRTIARIAVGAPQPAARGGSGRDGCAWSRGAGFDHVTSSRSDCCVSRSGPGDRARPAPGIVYCAGMIVVSIPHCCGRLGRHRADRRDRRSCAADRPPARRRAACTKFRTVRRARERDDVDPAGRGASGRCPARRRARAPTATVR